MRLASLSVDLDSLSHYCAIHSLDAAALPAGATHSVYRIALERFLSLFEELGLRATFFVVGKELGDEASAAQVARAFNAGHELGNHSWSHPYALTRLAAPLMEEEVRLGEEALAHLTGARPKGFRAPGYTLTAPLHTLLSERGYLYDSSAFPAAAYYLAKGAVMGALALAGRPSRAILDRPRVLRAPRAPYLASRREVYRRARPDELAGALLELPISVERFTTIPFIGTTALLLPERAASALYRSMRRRPFFNFELHGIDLLDAADVDFPPLARRQRELSLPWREKRARLRALMARVAEDFEVVTLEQAALRIGPTLRPL